jgi:hypothetical protein
MPLSLLLWGTLGCSDPAYYPQITDAYLDRSFEEDADDTATEGGFDLDDIPCSEDLGGIVTLEFVNQLSESAQYFWRDAACGLTYYGEIPPQGVANQQSYVGHVWVFMDVDGEDILGWTQTPADAPYQVVLQ